MLLVTQADGFANGARATAIEAFLREHGHDVTAANTYFLSRASTDSGSPLRKLPRPGLRRLAIYAVELTSLLVTRRWKAARRNFSYYLLQADFLLRRSLLGSMLAPDRFDVVFVEHHQDAGLITVPKAARVFYDCQTPYADELYYEEMVTARQRDKLRRRELDLFEAADAVTFSWESYAPYVNEQYGAPVRHLRQLNWGCQPVEPHERVQFDPRLRIVYLGSLSSRFIDLPLLARLSQLHEIDVYGGPPPDPSFGLNYCGWAPPTVLGHYQLGLITCTKDELRRSGFSAKNLDYIAYGLPVLVPAWRRHMEALRGYVSYDEKTFTTVIERLRDPGEWQRISDVAYAEAHRLRWENTLAPLQEFLREA